MSASVTNKAVQGVFWTYLSFAGGKLLLFIATVVLARVLAPAEFGQVALALLVIGYIEAVGDFGISSALIFEREKPEEAANIAFLVSIATGFLWFGLAFAAAPLIADFFTEPRAVALIQVTAAVFVINALGNTHDALLRRDLEFKKRIAPDFSQAIVKGGVSVALALAGWGVWSLVWGQIAGAVATTLALWWVKRWRPGLQASWKTTRRMLGYGSHIVSVNMISAVVHDADFAIVGRMLGSTALGFYSMAYRSQEFFITMIVWVVGKVAFPVYAKLRDDRAALQRAFLATLRYLSLITLPVGLGLAMVGGLFVEVFYGEKWAEAGLALQLLAAAGALRSLGSHAGDVYKATGRPDILTKLGVLRALVIVPAMIWGARFGIVGVATAQLIVTAASTLLNLHVASRVLSLPVTALLREFSSGFIASAAMAAMLALLLPAISEVPATIRFIFAVVAGAVVYFAVVLIVARQTVDEAWHAIRTALRRGTAAQGAAA